MAVLADAGELAGISTQAIDLFGFSGGAQFAHRFTMLHPHRVTTLAVASAGWYTFPTEQERFPYGIAPTGTAGRRAHAALAQFLETPILVLVGERDVTRDAGLRKEHKVDRAQGLTRVERGARWVSALRRTAWQRGINPNIRFERLPNCGHSFEECVNLGGLVLRVMDWFK